MSYPKEKIGIIWGGVNAFSRRSPALIAATAARLGTTLDFMRECFAGPRSFGGLAQVFDPGQGEIILDAIVHVGT